MSEPGAGDFDLDEDLFSFDEILDTAEEESEKVDLDELLRVLEDTSPETPTPSAEGEGEGESEAGEELIGAEPATAEPTAVPTEVVVAAPALSGRFVRVGIGILVGLALLNVVQIGLSWERSRDLTDALLEMESRFLVAAGDLQQNIFHQSEAMERNRLPVVAPQTAGRSSLEHIQRQLEAGQYAEARRRLFSLLSVLDRYDAPAAAEVEGVASYLLAESWRMQAEPSGEEPQ